MKTEGRFDRQLPLFGKEGQEKLRALRVAVIGVGGLGSHLVQQLAFLGVEGMCVIDPDVVMGTNMNRLIGAHHDDPSHRIPKVEVARRLVETIDPSIRVVSIQKDLISEEAFNVVRQADFVFGCLDNDGPRLVLSELCAAYRRPYFDLATEIPSDSPMEFGGRVCFSSDDNGCPVCLELLSNEEIRAYFSSPEQRRDIASLYGVPQNGFQGTGPSVVNLNGIIASLTATEFMLHSTGLRNAKQLLIYRGRDGKVTLRLDKPSPDCFYCKSVYGTGVAARVERYLAERGMWEENTRRVVEVRGSQNEEMRQC